jgi:hypothetical protein
VLGLSIAGCGGAYALVTADMLRRVDPSLVATAGGMTAMAQSVAYVVWNPIIGRVWDRAHSYDGIAIVLGLVALPGAIAWILWDPRRATGRVAP